MGPGDGSFLNSRKRAVLALRFVLVLAVAATALAGSPARSGPTAAVLAVYALTNVVLLFERPAAFLRRLSGMLLFVFDLGAVVTLMLLAGETRSHFYVAFFLIILMAGLTRKVLLTILAACLSAAAYGLLVGGTDPGMLLRPEFTTRACLFFVTALFSGALAEEANRERGARRRYEGFYRALFDQSGDGVLVAGADGIVREANPRARELLGRDPRGEPLEGILRGGGEGTSGSSPVSTIFRLDLDRPGGERVSCEALLRCLQIEGESHRMLILRDVGELCRLQERMAAWERETLLGDLLLSVTHELNNPLAVVLGYSELLEGAGIGAEEREYLACIREAGQRCKRVVDAFLDQCRVRPFRPVPVRLGEVVRGAARLMDYHLRYHRVKLELETGEGPEIMADPDQLEQLLIHLITHAVKSMEGGDRKVLRIVVREEGEDVLLEVSDTGRGTVPCLLGGLSTGGEGPRPALSGRILGLSMSFEIARRHGGTIGVRGEPGKGTIYSVRLPKVLRDITAEAA